MKKKATPALLILLFLTACEPSPKPAPHPGAAALALQPTAAQNFDYYLLNLSWSPEFCYGHPNATECAQHPTFVLHGLWPQNTDGTYPQNCSNAPGPADPSQYSDIYPDAGLLQHEWRTHGSCSGLSPDTFFAAARSAFRSFAVPPTLAQLNRQISLPPAQILDLVTQANPKIPSSSLALSCGNNFLTAIEVCLTKSGQPTPAAPSVPAAPILSASLRHKSLLRLDSTLLFSRFEKTSNPLPEPSIPSPSSPSAGPSTPLPSSADLATETPGDT